MKYMKVIFTMDTFARKSSVGITVIEESAKTAVVGSMKNGLVAGHEKLEVWESYKPIKISFGYK
ncbi:hypothetical protein [Bacillus cereus]|uniref:hypothetical protein n=1 Tax=Bacillus cereus TaxID=1396 RepID=UPI000951EA7E|nr:hypothetical protein [Bacillus cereus]OLR26038.1 hypothetical protein BLD50_09110 [Bacillus cereus]